MGSSQDPKLKSLLQMKEMMQSCDSLIQELEEVPEGHPEAATTSSHQSPERRAKRPRIHIVPKDTVHEATTVSASHSGIHEDFNAAHEGCSSTLSEEDPQEAKLKQLQEMKEMMQSVDSLMQELEEIPERKSEGHKMSATVAAALSVDTDNVRDSETVAVRDEPHADSSVSHERRVQFTVGRSSAEKKDAQKEVWQEPRSTGRSPDRRAEIRRHFRSRSRSNDKNSTYPHEDVSKLATGASIERDVRKCATGASIVSNSLMKSLGGKLPQSCPEPQLARLLPKVPPQPPKWTPAQEEVARSVTIKARASNFSDAPAQQQQTQQKPMTPMQAEVTRYLLDWGIHGGVASMFLNQSPEVQRAVLDQGPLKTARCPASVLVGRILKVQRGETTGLAYTPRR